MKRFVEGADRGQPTLLLQQPRDPACHEAGIEVTLPKPMTSGAKSEGRLGQRSSRSTSPCWDRGSSPARA